MSETETETTEIETAQKRLLKQTPPSHAQLSLAFVALAVALTLTQTIRVPVYPSYALVGVTTLPFVYWWFQTADLAPTDYVTLYTLVVFACLFVIGIVLRPSLGSLVRGVGYLYGGVVFLLVIPRVLPWRVFTHVVARWAAALVVLGLPLTVVPWYGELLPSTPLWYHPTPLPVIDMKIYPLVAVLQASTSLGALCAIGALCAVAEWDRVRSSNHSRLRVHSHSHSRSQSWVPLLLGGISTLGVYLTTSRMAAIALFAGGGLVVLFALGGRVWMGAAALAGYSALVYSIAVAFGSLPGPEVLKSIPLSGRDVIWTEVLELIAQRPYVGWGPSDSAAILAPHLEGRRPGLGVHNSYLRMVLMAGPVGGALYLGFHAYAVVQAYLGSVSLQRAFVFALVVVVCINELFNSATLLGLSFRSALYALILGYGIASPRTQHSNPRLVHRRGS